jgi:hypothetical protein
MRYFLDWLRRHIVDRAMSKGRIDSESSLFRLDPYTMRYVENDRCVDIYVERCGPEILLDIGSVQHWHTRMYETGYAVALAGELGEPIDTTEQLRIREVVERVLSTAHQK